MASPLLRVAERVGKGQLSFDLFGRANLWIEDSLEDSRSAQFAQWCIQSALDETAAGQVQLIVFDEVLSGLVAGFEAINSGGERILETVNDQGELKTILRELRNHIQAVNTVMRGLAPDLPEFRRQVDYPVESYKLIVLATDISSLDDETQNHIATLLKAGPRAGVSFLIHSTTVGMNPYVVGLCDRFVVKGDTVVLPSGESTRWSLPSPNGLITTAERVAQAVATAKADPIDFAGIHEGEVDWQHSSADGLTFAIGRHGVSTMEITLGDELNQRHNMLITGAVGQGKSNLLSVITHSIASRYGPEEVQFYLLDFKEGVTLQRFAGLDGDAYLPHARVLGLEADREFAHGVFTRLFDIYRERMRLFKAERVQSLREYRELHPDAELARLVVIIDEFQMMFAERDRLSDQLASLLTRAARLFRAAGIHFILASQTIGGNLALMGGAGEGLFNQVPIRIALKNSLTESHATLGAKNDAAAHLRAREGIVNLEYGELSANRKTAIAFADESVLGPLRTRWWTAARDRVPAPYVFLGERNRSLDDDAAFLDAVAAERAGSGGAPVALLGATIEVDGRPLAIPFNRDVGRNVALLGPGAAIVEIASVVLALAGQLGDALDVVVLDLLGDDPVWVQGRAVLEAALAGTGSSMTVVDSAEVGARIVELSSEAAAGRASGARTTLVLALGLDRLRDLPREFEELCKLGPAQGVHLVGWWIKLEAFQRQAGYGGASYFDTKIALQLDVQSTRTFMGDALLEWRPSANRALAWDSARMVEPVPIIPYGSLPGATSGATR